MGRIHEFTIPEAGSDPVVAGLAAATALIATTPGLDAMAAELVEALRDLPEDTDPIVVLTAVLGAEAERRAEGAKARTIRIRELGWGDAKKGVAEAMKAAKGQEVPDINLAIERELHGRALVAVGDRIVSGDDPATDILDEMTYREGTLYEAAFAQVNGITEDDLAPFCLSGTVVK